MTKSYSFEALGLLDISMDESMLNMVNLAARILDTPYSLISVVDEQKAMQFVSAECGALFEEPGERTIALEYSICRYVKSSGNAFAINDLLEDPRTRGNEVVVEKGLRSYIGSPIHALKAYPL